MMKSVAQIPEVPQSHTPVTVYGYTNGVVVFYSFHQRVMFPVYSNNPYEFDDRVISAFRTNFKNLFVLPYTDEDIAVPFGQPPRFGNVPVPEYEGLLKDVIGDIKEDGYDGIALISDEHNDWTLAINLTAPIEHVRSV
jgi:hypothetical protein